MFIPREHLNEYEKLRRSLYEVFRDTLTRHLAKIALVDSFYNFEKSNVPFPFVDKSELKPKSRKMERESKLFNTFIVICCEGTLGTELKNHIRFFPENAVVKNNIEIFLDQKLFRRFHKNLRYFDHPAFLDFLQDLIHVDYALLLQQDSSIKSKNRFALTHLHVKMDWPIAAAAQDLARHLRYIQSHLYENGDKEGRILQQKLFEYYGCHHTVGGRRTAGLIAAQLLRKQDFVSSVFVSSCESRIMYKYSERGVSKFFLIPFGEDQIRALARREGIPLDNLQNTYLYPAGQGFIGILEAIFHHTPHALPPEDGKLRRVRPAYNWLRLKAELLHPKLSVLDQRPLHHSWIYSAQG